MEEKKSRIDIKVFLLFFLIYILFMSGHMGGDSFWIYLTTESIVLDRNLVLNDHPDRVFAIKELESKYNFIMNHPSMKDDRVVSPYGFGLIIFQIPFFILGYLLSIIIPFIHRDFITMFFTSMTNCFVCALLCYVFYKICKLFNFSEKTSFWMTLALGLSSTVFPYSRQGFVEPLAALSLITTVYFIIVYFNSNKFKNILFCGICFSVGIWTRFDLVIYLPIISLFIIYKTKNINKIIKNIFIFYSPIFISVVIYLLYNIIRYNDYLYFGPQSKYISSLINFSPVSILINIYTLILSSGSGLVIFAPITLLFIFSITYIIKSNLDEFLLFTGIILTNILFYSLIPSIYTFTFAWGTRFAFIILPILFLQIGFFLEKNLHRKIIRYIFKSLLGLGFLVQLPGILVNSAQLQHLFLDIFKRGEDFTLGFEQLTYNPNFSPIILGYYQIVSAFKNTFMNEHLVFPVYNTVRTKIESYIPLNNVDFFDLWFTNALKIVDKDWILWIFILCVVFILVSLIYYFLLNLRKQLIVS